MSSKVSRLFSHNVFKSLRFVKTQDFVVNNSCVTALCFGVFVFGQSLVKVCSRYVLLSSSSLRSCSKTLNTDHLTLSQTTNFVLFLTERVCSQQCWIWWKWQKVLKKGRKNFWKRRNCLSWALSPFPTLFSKDFYWRDVKTRACLGKGKKSFCENVIFFSHSGPVWHGNNPSLSCNGYTKSFMEDLKMSFGQGTSSLVLMKSRNYVNM